MLNRTVSIDRRSLMAAAFGALLAVAVAVPARAELPADLQAQVDRYKTQLSKWAQDKEVIAAVKRANESPDGPVSGMTGAKWIELTDADPQVNGLLNSSMAQKLKSWESAHKQALGKLYLRNKDGFLVAGTNKPLLYNNKATPVYKNGMGDKAWGASEVKPDPTTQVGGVHVSAPVKDGGKTIGLLHTTVIAK